MTEKVTYGARPPQPDRAEVKQGGMVCMISDSGYKVGTVVQMSCDRGPNGMLLVLFEDEDSPREVPLRGVHAVAAKVTVFDGGGVNVVFFNTGAAANGTPGRLGVILYDSGGFSLVCDGFPCGRGERVVPADSVKASRRDVDIAERTALQALAALCDSDSDIFEAHKLDRVAMRQFVELRRAEIGS